MMYDDVTLILQGPITSKISKNIARGIKNLENYSKIAKTIISTWKGAELKPTKRYLVKYNIDIIESDEDQYKNMYSDANMNFQVASTLTGLKRVDTKYAIKLRCDESYGDLSKFIQKMRDNPDKIVTNNFFFSKNSYDPFHPSDHVIGGTTENIMSMFSHAYRTCLKVGKGYKMTGDYFGVPDLINRDGNNGVAPEVFLCFCYLKSKNVNIDLEKSVEIMKKYYEVVPVIDMGEFVCKYDISVVTNMNYPDYRTRLLPANFIHSMEEL